MAVSKKEKIVVAQDIKEISFEIEGATSLIMHKFSQKAKNMMLEKQMKKGSGKAREAKDPDEDFEESIYRTSNGDYGMPATAFKNAMVRASKNLGYEMTSVRTACFIFSDDGELVKIDGEPTKREDVVVLNGKTSDIRYRAEFLNWKATVRFEYDPTVLSHEQFVQIFSRAGKFVGVGEWRPERNGVHGCWKINRVAVIGGE